MDWSRTKSIFIIVFSILNIFLYSLYLERYTEAENYSKLSEPAVDARLEIDNITYPDNLEADPGEEPYISGTRKTFATEDAPSENIRAAAVEEDYLLNVAFSEPVSIGDNKSKESLEAFIAGNVYEGDEYVLWEVNEEENTAIFYQVIEGKTLYHSDSGKVTLFFNDEGKAVRYEQTIFTDLVPNAQSKDLISPKRAIETLYQNGLLQQNSEVLSVDLGYSVYVAVSDETRMFLPTWRVIVELEDGSTADYFVNAVKDGIIEFKAPEEEGSE
ncbi:two-component system regulatory protein YycI [Planococcus sp. CAU13]|uniref:two-component system regulatory protein YycI n=1 Tax=Planococcus sp. CAU13 TaxID=1541197 RepID=UPI00052FDD7C|nr:two-component system regulatory protein YycI [Planococcus sp. CAU13]